jgi:hypothetical protein
MPRRFLDQRRFERHSRGVRPTVAGVLVIREARAMLGALRRLAEALSTAWAAPPPANSRSGCCRWPPWACCQGPWRGGAPPIPTSGCGWRKAGRRSVCPASPRASR